jgi:hypothetical protein
MELFSENCMSEIYSIGWENGRPHGVAVVSGKNSVDEYTINYSKASEELYYHLSASTPMDGDRSGLDKLPGGVRTFEQLVEHFAIIEEEGAFCDECNDWLPDTGMCDHQLDEEFPDD